MSFSSQKMENLLNLSLSLTPEQRERAGELDAAYSRTRNTWELIVKCSGDIGRNGQPGVVVEELIAGYCLVTLREDLIPAFVARPEVEYVEMPKRLFYGIAGGLEISCFASNPVAAGLSGRGVLLAVIDSGIDYKLPCFRNPDGTTRIRYLWDQSLQGADAEFRPPEGFAQGIEYTAEQINAALKREESLATRDISGHGTAVASIAAGGGRTDGFRGAAPESELVIVKLGNADQVSFPRTTELMRAITYVVRKGQEMRMPVAVNLSFGNTYGAHDGTSLLERFLDNAAEIGRCVVCVGSGNEGAAAGHTLGMLRQGQTRTVELAVGNYQPSFGVQLWKNYVDSVELTLIAPNRERRQILLERPGRQQFQFGGMELFVYVGQPSPYSVDQEVYFEWLPDAGSYAISGIWRFEMTGIRIVSGNFMFYLPSEQVLNSETRFYAPVPQTTLTIPSTASKVITVGAYNSAYDAYADFSGRGHPDRGFLNGIRHEDDFLESGQIVKPDLVAPGVGIRAARVGGGAEYVTGTSFATPFVTGAAALLMEWGIVQGNDPYLYDAVIIGLS